MSVADNFDYSIPTPNRKDLMSLSTINANDAKVRPFKKMDTQRDWSINLYNLDIERSCPKRISVFTNKIDYINKVDDIERTNSKLLHYKLDKPEYNLSNADIEKSSPNLGNLHTTRCTNPLEPKYKLPHVDDYPPDEPRFIRNNMDIKDIDGARPNKYFKWETRDTFPKDNHGIEGSKPKKRYVRNTKYNNIDYSDLMSSVFRTKRQTNPLDPVYEIKYKNGEKYVHGMIDKSKPQTVYPYKYPEPFALRVNDIKGAQAGSKNRINQFSGCDFELTTYDIKGCNAGSLKKGITTQRCVNPLVPKYQFPGAVELNGILNDPFARTGIKREDTPNVKEKKMRKSESAKIGNRLALQQQHNEQFIAANNVNNSNEQSEMVYNQQSYEKGFNDQLYPKDEIKFNKEYYNKPKPFYGLIHDKYVCSSDNPEMQVEIDKKKENALKTKTSLGFFNSNGRAVSATVPFKQQQKTLQRNNSYNKTGRLLSAGGNKLNTNTYNMINDSNNMSGVNNRMSKSPFGKLTYAQKLDQFMESNNLKYIGEKEPKVKQDDERVPEGTLL
jgi:hypothetical protein